jgi:hypothetical protein
LAFRMFRCPGTSFSRSRFSSSLSKPAPFAVPIVKPGEGPVGFRPVRELPYPSHS